MFKLQCLFTWLSWPHVIIKGPLCHNQMAASALFSVFLGGRPLQLTSHSESLTPTPVNGFNIRPLSLWNDGKNDLYLNSIPAFIYSIFLKQIKIYPNNSRWFLATLPPGSPLCDQGCTKCFMETSPTASMSKLQLASSCFFKHPFFTSSHMSSRHKTVSNFHRKQNLLRNKICKRSLCMQFRQHMFLLGAPWSQ